MTVFCRFWSRSKFGRYNLASIYSTKKAAMKDMRDSMKMSPKMFFKVTEWHVW